MMAKRTAVLVVVLFTLNAATVVWMQLLPKESLLLKDLFSEEVDTDKAFTGEGLVKDMAGAHYVRLYRKHATANTVASVVLFLDACFVFAVALALCVHRETKESMTTKPPAGADAEDRAADARR